MGCTIGETNGTLRDSREQGVERAVLSAWEGLTRQRSREDGAMGGPGGSVVGGCQAKDRLFISRNPQAEGRAPGHGGHKGLKE